jgi:hypothetical protein
VSGRWNRFDEAFRRGNIDPIAELEDLFTQRSVNTIAEFHHEDRVAGGQKANLHSKLRIGWFER